jgi:YHS domain-containing protein
MVAMAHDTQARDPVCGMSVDTATAAHRSTLEGETYYFCSAACKRIFDADPTRYIERSMPIPGAHAAGDATGPDLERHEPPFTKRDGIVAPKFGSAGSGGAEYEPLPEAHDDPGKRD